ncbi:uncharacterized protein LOC122760981, partial [Tachysurus ichikawai]
MLHNHLHILPESQKKAWASFIPQMLFCYNTTPHQGTGESPFFLMFGLEPQLPIDFLLGWVWDSLPGVVQDCVAEHRASLWMAFECAHEQLAAAAGHRKAHYDQLVQVSGGGSVGLSRAVGYRDHKIQDRWGSVVYQLLKVPPIDGAVYTIAP